MTRINVIAPEDLTDQHLLAEYRELPRVFALARPGTDIPAEYTLGTGHVKFFYDKLGYLAWRHAALVTECLARGFDVRYRVLPRVPHPSMAGGWRPTPADRRINLSRLDDKIRARPGWYRHRGVVVPDNFYSRLLSSED